MRAEDGVGKPEAGKVSMQKILPLTLSPTLSFTLSHTLSNSRHFRQSERQSGGRKSGKSGRERCSGTGSSAQPSKLEPVPGLSVLNLRRKLCRKLCRNS